VDEEFEGEDRRGQLRLELGRVIVRRFKKTYEEHGISYDPDTCYEAAQDVMEHLAEKLVPWSKWRPKK
jgi:hypothetical protein